MDERKKTDIQIGYKRDERKLFDLYYILIALIYNLMRIYKKNQTERWPWNERTNEKNLQTGQPFAKIEQSFSCIWICFLLGIDLTAWARLLGGIRYCCSMREWYLGRPAYCDGVRSACLRAGPRWWQKRRFVGREEGDKHRPKALRLDGGKSIEMIYSLGGMELLVWVGYSHLVLSALGIALIKIGSQFPVM